MNKEVGAIIQARTSSVRLPKKVLKKIGNFKVIEWVINRTKKSKLLKKIILATTTESCDNPLVIKSKKLKVDVFRGSKDNVLLRYIESAKYFDINIIVRICADRPFIDPEFIDQAVEFFLNNNCDLVFNHNSLLGTFWPVGFGVEVLSLDLLEEIYNKKLPPEHLEHVTSYIWDNKKKYKIMSPPLDIEKQSLYKTIKLDLDTNDDLNEIKKIQDEIFIDSTAYEIINNYIKFK